MGQRLNIIIIAEGAIDQKGNKITPDYVREVRPASTLHI